MFQLLDAWLRESTAIDQLWRSTLMELKALVKAFVPHAATDQNVDEQTRASWHRRYEVAVKRVQAAGVKTNQSGAEEYISLRAEWDRYITSLAPEFAYELDEIDTALAKVK